MHESILEYRTLTNLGRDTGAATLGILKGGPYQRASN